VISVSTYQPLAICTGYRHLEHLGADASFQHSAMHKSFFRPAILVLELPVALLPCLLFCAISVGRLILDHSIVHAALFLGDPNGTLTSIYGLGTLNVEVRRIAKFRLLLQSRYCHYEDLFSRLRASACFYCHCFSLWREQFEPLMCTWYEKMIC
jgi:hypothetical protein